MCGKISGTRCAFGRIAGSTDSGSMSPTASARTCPSRIRRGATSLTSSGLDGSHPLWDRDDVHEIYADWRRILNSYDPPRYAVAEASVHPARRARYASPDSLGHAFNFAMQDADWRLEELPQCDQRRTGRHDQKRLNDQLAAWLPRLTTSRHPIRAAVARRASSPTDRPGVATDRRCRAAA